VYPSILGPLLVIGPTVYCILAALLTSESVRGPYIHTFEHCSNKNIKYIYMYTVYASSIMCTNNNVIAIRRTITIMM
jgi:hypothetical protein